MVGPSLDARGGIAAAASTLTACEAFRAAGGVYVASSRTMPGIMAPVGWVAGYSRFCTLAWRSGAGTAYIHVSSRFSFMRKSLYVLTARMAGMRVILHVHPDHFREFLAGLSPLGRSLARAVLGSCHALVALNPSMAGFLASEAPRVPVHVLPNGIEVGRFEDGSGVPRRPGRLLYLGSYLGHKGVFDLLEAFAAVRRRHPGANLHLYGDRDARGLKRYAGERGLSGGVSINGWLGFRAKTAQLHAASVLVLPSHTEGMPMVLLEAMAAGTPLVATRVGGVPDLLDDGCATLVPPRDPGALAGAIGKILENPAMALEKAELARKRVAAFDAGAIGRLFEAIVSAHTGKRRRTKPPERKKP